MSPHAISFRLKPVAPFRLDLTAWALRRDPRNMVDRWDGREFRRVMLVGGVPVETAVVQIGPVETPELMVRAWPVSTMRRLRASIGQLLDRVLGLSLDLLPFYAFAAKQPRLGRLARRFRGLKPPRFPTVWEAVVNAISCQQVSLTVGVILMNRLAARFGLASANGKHALPRPVDLVDAHPSDLRELGYSFRKAAMILALAEAIRSSQIDLDTIDTLGDEAAIGRLREIKGVGRWSAEYILLRGLGRLNVFPADDVGFQNKLGKWLHLDEPLDYDGVRQIVHKWRRHGGLIYFFMLLNHLDEQGHLTT